MLDKFSRCFYPAIEKDRARHSFKNVGEQSMFAAAATLLFAATEAKELSKLKLERRLGERRRAYQPMLHARQFAFGGAWISAEEIFSNDQPQHRIAEKLHCLIVQVARLRAGAWRHLLVRPRAMRHGLRQQRRIAETIIEN